MQRTEEPEPESLAECSRRLLLNSYTTVGKRKLDEEKRSEEKYVDTRLNTNQPFEQIPQA